MGTHHINLINDIEILSEKWSNCKMCKNITTDNYELLKIAGPLKNGSVKGRKSGGTHIYCNSHVKPYLKVIKTSNSYLWVEIDARPITSTYYSDEIWNEFEIDLLNLTTNETPFCTNGRVGEWSEFSQPDKNVI